MHTRKDEAQLHSFLASALVVGELSTSGPGHFTNGQETRYPLSTKLGGPQGWYGRFWRTENLLLLPRFELRMVHLYPSHYTDYDIRALYY